MTKILFACTHNMIRSPMAEAWVKKHYSGHAEASSCGTQIGEVDGFTINAMNEIGIDISSHEPQDFASFTDESFDLIICFSEESYNEALAFAKDTVTKVEYWDIYDTGLTSENHERRQDAYRGVRDAICARLDEYFSAKK